MSCTAGCACRSCGGSIAAAKKTSRMRRRARGMGDLSFQTLSSDPQFSAAWGKIQSTISNEGGTHLDLLAAQNVMASAFSTVTTQFHYTGEQALSAATQLTTAGQTIAGAVAQVEGLVSVAQGGDPGAFLNTFAGTLIAAATATGAVSAGVGALVVAGIALVASALDSLLGPSHAGYSVCDYKLDSPPTIVIGCVSSKDAQPVSPGAFGWRHFPNPNNPADAWWFYDGTSLAMISTEWGGARWFKGFATGPKAIAINLAWPQYSSLLLDSMHPDTRAPDFQRGLFAAWQANAELALNGCKTASDSDVLLHYVRTWNRAHDGSSYVDVHPGSYVLPAFGAFGLAAPSKLETSWAATQITALQRDVGPDEPGQPAVNYLQPSGALRIYTGARKTPPVPAHITLTLHLGAGKTPTTSTKAAAPKTAAEGPSTAAVLVATVGAAALAWVILARATGRPLVPRAIARRVPRRLLLR